MPPKNRLLTPDSRQALYMTRLRKQILDGHNALAEIKRQKETIDYRKKLAWKKWWEETGEKLKAIPPLELPPVSPDAKPFRVPAATVAPMKDDDFPIFNALKK